MNEAEQLLRRALEQFGKWHMQAEYDWNTEYDLKKDIENYLANQETAKDEPVAWTNQDELNALGTDVTCYMYSEHDVLEDSIPLYLHPAKPERKPMTEDEIETLYCAYGYHDFDLVSRYVIELARAVEKHHKIGEKDD